MAWRRAGDKPLPEQMLAYSMTHTCGTRGEELMCYDLVLVKHITGNICYLLRCVWLVSYFRCFCSLQRNKNQRFYEQPIEQNYMIKWASKCCSDGQIAERYLRTVSNWNFQWMSWVYACMRHKGIMGDAISCEYSQYSKCHEILWDHDDVIKM